MRTLLLITCASILPYPLFAQHTVESLVQTGIEFHDAQEYDKAINTYKVALEIEPNSPVVNYELALSYMESGQYDSSIKYSDKVISLNTKLVADAYVTKASSLDYKGFTDESIQILEKAIHKYDENYLLYYNLGINYFKKNDYTKAQKVIIKTLQIKPNHASSHLLLAAIATQTEQTIPSILSLYYFLLLEPDTERSKAAYVMLQTQLNEGVHRDAEDSNRINIYFNPKEGTDEHFRAAELLLSMLTAAQLKSDSPVSKEELFLNQTKALFNSLGESSKKQKKKADIVWKGYIPFFHELSQSEHLETFCHYISYTVNPRSSDWLLNNKPQLKQFADWTDQHDPRF